MNTQNEYELKLALARQEFPELTDDEFGECSRCGVVEPREVMRTRLGLVFCDCCFDD